jgi:hypothetical protein
MPMELEAILLFVNALAKVGEKIAIAMTKDDDSWKDIRLGDLFIDEDYAAVKERVRKEREGQNPS